MLNVIFVTDRLILLSSCVREQNLAQSLAREEKLKYEMVYYKNELKNREDNYNSIFGHRTKQNVGKVNSLISKKPPTPRIGGSTRKGNVKATKSLIVKRP